jgi:hypothetical protein
MLRRETFRFPARTGDQPTDGSMSLELSAINLGEQSLHLHGASDDGAAFRVT